MSNNFNVTFFLDYRHYDMPLNYFYRFSKIFDESIEVILFLFALFFFSCEWLISKLNLQHRTWKFWYQFAVQSQDDYYSSKYSDEQLEKVLTLLTKKYRAKFFAIDFVESLPFFFIVREHVYKNCAKAKAFFNMLDVDQDAFMRRPSLVKLPNLSFNNRCRAVVSMIASDVVFFYFQIKISKICKHF